MKKYLRLFILSFVLLRPVPDLLAFEPPPLQGSQKVFYAQNPRGPLGMDSFLSEQGMNKKEFILQRRADEKYSYQVSFSVNSDNSVDLVGIERFTLSDQKLMEFRHKAVVAGQETWTHWIMGSLEKKGTLPWPTYKEGQDVARGLMLLKGDPVLARAEAELALKTNEFHLFEAAPLRVLDRPLRTYQDWAPGVYSWSYDPGKFKVWAGYLWDFQKGLMFRGYREPESPGALLTPSQNLESSEITQINSYYSLVPWKAESSNEENSRWLSPLDKYGIWAERSSKQFWYLPSAWEAANHSTNFTWGGYCNASTALPFLWKKPQHSIVDHRIVFDPRDLVGLMQVASYQVDYIMWGNRFNGKAQDDVSDPDPETSINILSTYLGDERIPVIFDHEAGPAVGNLLALSAKLEIENTVDPQIRHATLSIASLGNLEDFQLIAKQREIAMTPEWNGSTMQKVYGFKIYLDAGGNLKSTVWDDKEFHPDFFWLPTGHKDYPPPYYKNPYLPLASFKQLVEKSYLDE